MGNLRVSWRGRQRNLQEAKEGHSGEAKPGF